MGRLTIPNIITSVRLFGAVALIFVPYPGNTFLIIYALCGISDILDGMIARLTSTQSEWGSKFDSIADLAFYSVTVAKMIPSLIDKINNFVWILLGVVIFVRIIVYIVAAVKYRRFASQHTYLNKLTGLAVFCLPFLLAFITNHTLVCIVVCVIGLASSIEEFFLHITSKKYDVCNKTLFF